MLQKTRLELTVCGIAAWIAFSSPLLAQTAGEGSGSEVVGAGGMIKSPEHAEKGGDTDQKPKLPDDQTDRPSEQRPKQRSDEEVSSGSPSPSTAPK